MMKLIERDKANCSRSAGLWQNLLIYSKQNSTGNNIQTTLRVYSGCHFISTKWMLFKAVILTNCKLTTHTHILHIYQSTEIHLQDYDRGCKIIKQTKGEVLKLRLTVNSELDLMMLCLIIQPPFFSF